MTTSLLTLCAGMALMADPQAAPSQPAKPAAAQPAKPAVTQPVATPVAKTPAALPSTPAAGPAALVHTVKKPVAAKQVSFAYFPVEEAVVAKTNAERARYGLPPLELDPNLVKTARAHTWWMTRNRSLQHGSYPVAENIAMGQNSSHEVVHSWMNSSGHRANILNRGHRRIGVAAYTTPSGTTYWCQQFTH